MIERPNDWNESPAIIGGARTLPVGNYKCKIVNVENAVSKTGNKMLKIFFDIDEGDYAGIYMDRYLNSKKSNEAAKYPSAGVYYQLLGEGQTGRLKGLIQSLEMSNPSFKWNWNEQAMNGCVFAGQFREKEYFNQNGELKTFVELVYIHPLEELANLDVLPMKQVNKAGMVSQSRDESVQQLESIFGGSATQPEHIPF